MKTNKIKIELELSDTHWEHASYPIRCPKCDTQDGILEKTETSEEKYPESGMKIKHVFLHFRCVKNHNFIVEIESNEGKFQSKAKVWNPAN